MELTFLDTSALVKGYVAEPGSDRVQHLLLGAPSETIYLAKVAGAEFVAAMKRKERTGALSADRVGEAIRSFRRTWRQACVVMELDDQRIEEAMDLAERHDLRGFDAIQLASACNLRRLAALAGDTVTFWCSDAGLLAGAQAEGIATINPAAP